MGRRGYMMIKEATVAYGVSRAKLHRLVQQGRLETSKDPRDERVTLIRTEELEALFQFPEEEAGEMRYETGTKNAEQGAGRITAELMARMDAIRERIAARGRTLKDSAEIIREEREKRARQIDQAAFGARKKGRKRA